MSYPADYQSLVQESVRDVHAPRPAIAQTAETASLTEAIFAFYAQQGREDSATFSATDHPGQDSEL